ncbi:MAG: VOC family protein [Rhodospirillaceae bacterium]
MRFVLSLLASLLIPLSTTRPALADGHEAGDGYATFIRTAIVARYSDLEPSVTFWRDVMGFQYAGDPKPRTGYASPLGWVAEAVTYFTTFSSKDGAMVGLLMVEDSPGFPEIDLPDASAAHGGVVLVHTAINLRAVYDRAVDHGFEVLKPFGLSQTGLSEQILIKAPTGQLVEVYELIEK